jgi:transposase
MDNAAYNKSSQFGQLASKLGINLFYLPRYSPNLTPVERLWKFFKKKVLYNKYYETRGEFENAVQVSLATSGSIDRSYREC